MATYKVIQDIEAEDKLVGPLSLRQFIYAAIAAISLYISFFSLSKGYSFVLVMLSPVILFTGFFAFPWGSDQPTEVWALAKIRFFLKSRRRIWDQSGVKDLVTVTVPKRIEKEYTNGLQPHEVESRLTALASMLDSRGWAVKNVTSAYMPPAGLPGSSSDRLMDITALPNNVQAEGVTAADDILDPENNASAHRLQEMVDASSMSRRKKLMTQLKQAVTPSSGTPSLPKPTATPAAPAADYWFLNKPLEQPIPGRGNAVFTEAPVVHAGDNDAANSAEPTAAEEALAVKLKEQHDNSQLKAAQHHLKTIMPLGIQAARAATEQPPATPAAAPPAPEVTRPANPATMNLVNNNDLSVAAIQSILKKEDADNGEVVISLHGK